MDVTARHDLLARIAHLDRDDGPRLSGRTTEEWLMAGRICRSSTSPAVAHEMRCLPRTSGAPALRVHTTDSIRRHRTAAKVTIGWVSPCRIDEGQQIENEHLKTNWPSVTPLCPGPFNRKPLCSVSEFWGRWFEAMYIATAASSEGSSIRPSVLTYQLPRRTSQIKIPFSASRIHAGVGSLLYAEKKCRSSYGP